LRYIASGSSTFSPSRKATVGDVGVTTKSNREKTSLKSSEIFVRNCCARPYQASSYPLDSA